MGTAVVMGGTLHFPTRSAMTSWRRHLVDSESVPEWCEPVVGPGGPLVDALSVGAFLRRLVAPGFGAGKILLRTTATALTVAGSFDADGVAAFAPALVACAFHAASVGAEGALFFGYIDSEGLTAVHVGRGAFSMEQLEDDDALESAYATAELVAAQEVHVGRRASLDDLAIGAPAKAVKKAAARAKDAPRPKAKQRPFAWKHIVSGTHETLTAIAVGPGGELWAAGQAGALVRGSLEGPWTRVVTGVSTALFDVYPTRQGPVFAAGYELLRIEGDRVTVCSPAPNGAAIMSVLAEGPLVVAVDATGTIFRSADGGASWTVVHRHPEGVGLERIVRGGGDRFHAVGLGGTLLSSYDGARSFASRGIDARVGLAGAVVIDRDLFVVGMDRILLVPEDGDDRATYVGPLRDRDEDFRYASTAAGALFVVKAGGLLRSTDRGATWESIHGRPNDFPFAVQALSADEVVIVGPRGSAWRGRAR